MKHTPGPWKLIVDDKAYFGDELKIVTDNRHIATVNPATNEGPANAQLIASAPDLLEENARLKEANQTIIEHIAKSARHATSKETARVLGKVEKFTRKFLAKAEGES